MSKLLIAKVAERCGMSQKDTKEVVDGMLEEIRDELFEGEEVSFFGFGKFSTSYRAGRDGRNPQTGEAMKIKPSTQVKFKPSITLKNFVNRK